MFCVIGIIVNKIQ